MSPAPETGFVAVDWSGALHRPETGIRLAEARGPELVRVEGGRDRAAVIDELRTTAERTPEVVIGLDFAFAFPAWFARSLGARSGPELWQAVEREGEGWLARSPAPFWGRPGTRKPPEDPDRPLQRRTERQVARECGVRPKSVFQIGGAGSVGTGSIRGMPWLTRLRAAGFAVWPFDPPALPVVVEIYPRLLTGAVNKSAPGERRALLEREFPGWADSLRARAAESEDAFDAAVSAARMALAPGGLGFPEAGGLDRLEGRIWRPTAVAPLATDLACR